MYILDTRPLYCKYLFQLCSLPSAFLMVTSDKLKFFILMENNLSSFPF